VKILVVDDDPGIRRFFTDMVKSLYPDAVFSSATNGDLGWAMVENAGDKFDLVITGVEMPGIDGIKLTGLIKHHCKETRIILISGTPKQPKHEADLFLAQPVRVADILPMVRRLMETQLAD